MEVTIIFENFQELVGFVKEEVPFYPQNDADNNGMISNKYTYMIDFPVCETSVVEPKTVDNRRDTTKVDFPEMVFETSAVEPEADDNCISGVISGSDSILIITI